jgi:pimeloyl-ACP methyl ester carboxylesterase
MKRVRRAGWGWLGGLVGSVSGIFLGGCGPAGDRDGDATAAPDVNVAVASAVSSRPSSPRPGSAPPVPALAWAPCGDDFPGVSCAVATVPLDYREPCGDATTSIALAKVPAADPAHKIGTVFVNPGGPGVSGVGLVLNGFGDLLGTLLGGRFDVVGFDPRGVGASEPLRCFESAEAEGAFLASQPLFPYLPEQKRPFFLSSLELAHRCLDGRPRIAAHMSTADVVRDLDLLRQAVGDARLTYLGFSYGSFLGNTYANMFPDKVRALVIDGVLDPALWSSGRQIDSDRVATAREFAEFLRLCDEAGADCPLSGPDGAGARFDALAAALRAQPLVIDDTLSYGYDLLVGDSAGAMYAPEYWGGAEGYAALFAALSDAVLGAPEAAAKARAVRAALRKRLADATTGAADYDNGLEAYYGNQCADTEYPSSFVEFRMTGAYAEAGSIFGPLWWWGNAPCAAWPVAADRYAGPWTARTSAPVLVVGNLFDGVTDYGGAVATSKMLRNSRLLTYAGWGHTAFGRSACVTDHVVAYLGDGTLPATGTVCPANPNPFLPEPALGLLARATGAAAGGVAGPAAPVIGLPPVWLGR